MKTLAIGDMHFKQSLILPIIDKVCTKYKPDNIVFLGDYCDEWGASFGDGINELKTMIDWYERHKDEYNITFLCGNHDFQYLVGEFCSGTSYEGHEFYKPLLEQLNLKIAIEIDDYLYSHAGLNSVWAYTFLNDFENIVEDLQLLFESDNKSAFNLAGYKRGGNGYPSPLWADAEELISCHIPQQKQVVGHTPVKDIINIGFEDGSRLVFCDTFSLHRNRVPIGNGSMVIIENDSVIPVNILDDFDVTYDAELIMNWDFNWN